MKKNLLTFAILFCLVLIATIIFSLFALHRGETIDARWIIIAAALILFLGYRYYSAFIANKVLRLDPNTITPAIRHNDGLDYVPTHRNILFGHHFAAIAGAGPLIGPVLAAQMGYLPGALWILVGAVLAGAVQDLMILVISMRNDGRSLGELVKIYLGKTAGVLALISTFLIMLIVLAALALIVVKALSNSPWSLFAVAATIPIALFMGIYLNFLRPGRVGEVSWLGLLLLIAAILSGKYVAANPQLAPFFTFSPKAIAWMLMIYSFFAAVLPVWLLLAPRDYLSTFLKIGIIFILALAILIFGPQIKMPAVTQFIHGGGPVWSGALFPFLFITIACGAISGFHALIASGTTPKMIKNEKDARLVGYGSMLLESFVAIVALIAATSLDPGIYFAINSPEVIIGSTVQSAAQTISSWGFVLTPDMLINTTHSVGETTLLSRTGGAPTFAIGIAKIFSMAFMNPALLAFWYHFAILFEAIFILTVVDAGTRVGRYVLQNIMGLLIPSANRQDSWVSNISATALCVAAWGYFLYQGIIDPLGGIHMLWPLFGISNQMLAAIALSLATVVLILTQRKRYLWVTLIPTLWLIICTLSAGFAKVFSSDPEIGFFAFAKQYQAAINDNVLMAPATNFGQMQHLVVNNYVDGILILFFMAIVIFIFVKMLMCLKTKGN